jgi:hypothetical protein
VLENSVTRRAQWEHQAHKACFKDRQTLLSDRAFWSLVIFVLPFVTFVFSNLCAEEFSNQSCELHFCRYTLGAFKGALDEPCPLGSVLAGEMDAALQGSDVFEVR